MRIDRKKLDMLLAKRCKTMTELSKDFGFSRQYLYQVTRAKNQMPKTVGRLAAALGVEVEDIIEQTDGRD